MALMRPKPKWPKFTRRSSWRKANGLYRSCVFIVLWAVERYGRRPMMIFGMTGMAIGHIVMAMCFHYQLSGAYVPIVLTLTVGMSNLSISPLAWVILAEIFPTNIRARAMGIATFALYLAMFLMNCYFPPVKEYFEETYGTPAGIFIILAVICFACVGFVYKMVPETKGKSLEEISNSWLSKAK